MKRLVGVVVAVLAQRASANACNEFTPQIAEPSIIAGCWMTVYVHPDNQVSMAVTASHDGGPAEVIQATVEENAVAIDVTLDDYDTCTDTITHDTVAYRAYTISNFDVPVGDYVAFDGVGGYVTPAASCVFSPPPSFSCKTTTHICSDNEDLECNAGGPSGFGLIALVLGWLLKRGGRTTS